MTNDIKSLKELTPDELKREIAKCDDSIATLNRTRIELSQELYEKEARHKFEKIIGKYVMLPGYYTTEEEEKDNSTFRLFKVEDLTRTLDSRGGYFKISHYVCGRIERERFHANTEGTFVEFADSSVINEYHIDNIENCTVLTEEEYHQRLRELKTRIIDEFEKCEN